MLTSAGRTDFSLWRKVCCIVAIGTPMDSKQKHTGFATLASQRRIAIGIPLDDIFSRGILGAENEIKNYLAIVWIPGSGEIDGWIGRLAFVK